MGDGVKKCNPVLLEPMMKVEVESPDDFLGSVIGDLSSRRGQVEGQSVDDGLSKVQAKVPLAEMFGYATQLRSMTQGRGIFSMEATYKNTAVENTGDRKPNKKTRTKNNYLKINNKKNKELIIKEKNRVLIRMIE